MVRQHRLNLLRKVLLRRSHGSFLPQSLKYLLLPCCLAGHWCFSEPSYFVKIAENQLYKEKVNHRWVCSRELGPFTKGPDCWQGRDCMVGKLRDWESEGQVSLVWKRGAVGAGRLSRLTAPLLLVAFLQLPNPGTTAAPGPSSILRRGRAAEPGQAVGGSHRGSDLGGVMWQSRTAEIRK